MFAYVNTSQIRGLRPSRCGLYGLSRDRGERSMYIVIKTVKGRRYLYQQRTWREGRRVRTESRYIGPLDKSAGTPSSSPRRQRKGALRKLAELIAANTLSPDERAQIVDEDALLKEEYARQAAREKARADFEAKTGMKLGPPNPTPQEKPPSSINSASPVPSPQATTVAPTDAQEVETEPGESQLSELSTATDSSSTASGADGASTSGDGGEGHEV